MIEGISREIGGRFRLVTFIRVRVKWHCISRKQIAVKHSSCAGVRCEIEDAERPLVIPRVRYTHVHTCICSQRRKSGKRCRLSCLPVLVQVSASVKGCDWTKFHTWRGVVGNTGQSSNHPSAQRPGLVPKWRFHTRYIPDMSSFRVPASLFGPGGVG